MQSQRRTARFVPCLAAGGAAGAARGVPLPRLPARGHRRRGARLPRRRGRRARAGSSTRRRCRTSATSCTTSAGTAAASACHGPDRSHLIVPGFRSSRIHILNVADDPRAAADREGDRAARRSSRRRATRGRTPSTACRATTSWSRCSATPTATAPAASPSSTRRRSRSRAAGRTAASTPPLNYDFWYQPRKNVLVSSRVRRAERLREGLRPRRTSARAATGSRLHFWDLAERTLRADDRPRRERAGPARGALAARPRGRGGLRRRRALEHDVALPPRQRRAGRPSRSSRSTRSSSRAGRSRCRG